MYIKTEFPFDDCDDCDECILSVKKEFVLNGDENDWPHRFVIVRCKKERDCRKVKEKHEK